MASTLGAALFYIGKGWPVVPVWPIDFVNGQPRCRCGNSACRSIGKHPITKFNGKPVAPKGVLDATTSRRVIHYWWGMVPDANIGVRGTKFFALDVDDPGALLDLKDHGDLPDTVESISGSGGTHILFKQPEGMILGNEEGDLPHGINVRGDSGYIIVAPSTHKSGEGVRYEWEVSSHPRDIELADAPDWLVDMISKPSANGKIEEIECAKSIPEIDGLSMHPKIKSLIINGTDDGDDRSSVEQKVIVALLSAGCEPEEVKAIFAKYLIGTEGKYAERGDVYLDRSIARAIAYIGPVTKKPKAQSIIVPGKEVPEHEARLERMAMDRAYLRGWHDALQGNPSIVGELWPNVLSVSETSIAHYGLGMRVDYPVAGGEYAALVVPYSNEGAVENVGYELHSPPSSVPSRVWESESDTHVFDTDVDGSPLSGRVLVTEDWDTAMHTFLNYGHMFKWLAILGLPDIPGVANEETKLASLRALAGLLADSEQVLLAWPASRRKDGSLLASLLEAGNDRVFWLTMPGPMRQMYSKYGMEPKHLNRYIQGAVPIA